jgi:hypothetical protein
VPGGGEPGRVQPTSATMARAALTPTPGISPSRVTAAAKRRQRSRSGLRPRRYAGVDSVDPAQHPRQQEGMALGEPSPRAPPAGRPVRCGSGPGQLREGLCTVPKLRALSRRPFPNRHQPSARSPRDQPKTGRARSPLTTLNPCSYPRRCAARMLLGWRPNIFGRTRLERNATGRALSALEQLCKIGTGWHKLGRNGAGRTDVHWSALRL